MDNNKDHISEKILNLTLEIMKLLTGEDYLVVKASAEHATPVNYPGISEDFSRTQSPIKGPLPHLPIYKRNKNQAILNIINRITELLTGEVPLRCQDVAIYLSMEEWEYLEGHKDQYKDVMMEDQPPLTSSEKWPSRLDPKNPPQDEGLVIVKVEEVEEDEKYVWDQECKEEEIPARISPDGRVLSLNCGLEDSAIQDYTQDSGEASIPLTSVLSRSDPCPMDEPDIDTHNGSPECKTFSCPECGKSFIQNAILLRHLKTHTGEKPYACFECGKCFTRNEYLIYHQRTHRRIKPYPCAECGECFSQDSDLKIHQRTHRGEQCYSCPDCGKPFIEKDELVSHQTIHLDEKTYTCFECGKCFARKTFLVTHQRIHTGEKPFPCSECKKAFATKSDLLKHQRVHTGERPFPCLECGKSFGQKSDLVKHQRIHTGEKPFLCSDCGKCFTQKTHLLKHQRVHRPNPNV